MHGKEQFQNLLSQTISVAATIALTMTMLFPLMVVVAPSVEAQTFKVIYNFTGLADGAHPSAGLTMDAAGSLYGTAMDGGYSGGNCVNGGCGAVFKLSKHGPTWTLNPLYNFLWGGDGAFPDSSVVFGPDGSLYGGTTQGGDIECYNGWGCGTVFNLRPPPTACLAAVCSWTETMVYRFQGGNDGYLVSPGSLVFDRAGNIYGTTTQGGGNGCSYGNGCGTFYQLTPTHGGWEEKVLYSFQGGSDGAAPTNLIFDGIGNAYGTTGWRGEFDWGTVFELSPSQSGWTEKTLYTFQGGSDGGAPLAGLVLDQSGNLYGATTVGGSNGGGALFMLTPSDGNWTFTVLHSFTSVGPSRSLTMDAAGNLYGTALYDGAYNFGSIFKLTHGADGWTYTSLYDFCPKGLFNCTDGAHPDSTVMLDGNGNLYGTAGYGGAGVCGDEGCGVIWEITP